MRVVVATAAVGMSAFGPKRTLAFALQMSAFDPKRTSPPTLQHFTHLIAEPTKIASRRESLSSASERRAKQRGNRKLSSDCLGNSRKVHREFSKLMRKMEGPTDGGVMEDGRDIRHVSLVESGG